MTDQQLPDQTDEQPDDERLAPQGTWRGRPLYRSPDGRMETLDRERFAAYMREQYGPPKPNRLQTLRVAEEARTGEPDTNDEVTADELAAATGGPISHGSPDPSENDQPEPEPDRRRRGHVD